MTFFSIDRPTNAFSRSSDIVLRKVLMDLRVEKHCSHSVVDMDDVHIISNSLYVFVKIVFRFLSVMNIKSGKTPPASHMSSLS